MECRNVFLFKKPLYGVYRALWQKEHQDEGNVETHNLQDDNVNSTL